MTPGAGERGNPDGAGAGVQQGFRRGACGGAGGEDVVDQQEIFAGDRGRIGDAKRSAKVEAALAGCESSLTLGGALSQQCLRGKGQLPGGVSPAQRNQCFCGKQTGLVKAATAIFGAMKGNRYDKQFCRSLVCQLRDSVGEQASERARNGPEFVVFEGVDGVAHATVVGGAGNGALEGRRRQAAGAAECGV